MEIEEINVLETLIGKVFGTCSKYNISVRLQVLLETHGVPSNYAYHIVKNGQHDTDYNLKIDQKTTNLICEMLQNNEHLKIPFYHE